SQATGHRHCRIYQWKNRHPEHLMGTTLTEESQIAPAELETPRVVTHRLVNHAEIRGGADLRVEIRSLNSNRQRIPSALGGPLEIAHQQEVVCHRRIHETQSTTVLEFIRDALRLAQALQDSPELSEWTQRIAQLQPNVDGRLQNAT